MTGYDLKAELDRVIADIDRLRSDLWKRSLGGFFAGLSVGIAFALQLAMWS